MKTAVKFSVIIPVYNEKTTLPLILERVQKEKPTEIIIVDDHSTDGTEEFLSSGGGSAVGGKTHLFKNVKVVRHERNSGKGAAVRTGIQNSTQEIVLIQDADLEYDPAEYERLLQPIADNKADVVYGSRFIGSSPHRVMFFWHFIGNRLLTLLCNIASNLNLTDMETGFKAFRKKALDSIKLEESDFGFEPEVTIKLARAGWRFYEIGISYHGRDYNEGKKIRWTDGVKAVAVILKYWLN
ncbi:MAG: glycosyltransferase family 2 protein [bacterium]|nr:glycosyltransferase family 2 protein [bacterium]